MQKEIEQIKKEHEQDKIKITFLEKKMKDKNEEISILIVKEKHMLSSI